MDQPRPDDFVDHVHLPLRQIAMVCEEFENHWSADEPSEFEQYLNRVEACRTTLMRNLLQIELRRCQEAGRQASADPYIDRYPDYADLIREEFAVRASTVINSMVGDTQFGDQPSRPALRAPSVVRLGDYVLEKELGRGAMGIVFAARHLRHGTCVALKTLPTVDGAELKRFKQEFRTLADVNHPNLVGLQNLQVDDGQWFFTMDLVEGQDFFTYVRPQGRLDLDRLRDAFTQLVTGLVALHAQQIVHRDLKPSNVMVSHEGRVVLLDFGLALDLKGVTQAEPENVGGTPWYMAPEQLHPDQAGPAVDWYAIGVMLYQALAGRVPFSGSLAEIMASKQTQDPPSLGRDVPDDMAGLCRHLLCRDPRQRAQSADAFRVLSARGAPQSVATREQFSGRTEQLSILKGALAAHLKGSVPRTLFISGRSGEGKTVLAEQFLRELHEDRAWTVLEGRCYDRESLPFKALDTLVDALCNHLRRLPDTDAVRLVPREAAVLAELFPVLGLVPAVATLPRVPIEGVEPQRVRQYAARALREILKRLSQQTKLVCFIDDLQWGDEGSAELLFDVLRPPGAPCVLFLGTYRSDEAMTSPFLQTWQKLSESTDVELPRVDCQLAPLNREESVALVLDVVGADTPNTRNWALQIAEETGGNPFLLTELAGCYDSEADTIGAIRIEDVIERKLALLPKDAREFLEVVSVSGQALSIDEAARTAGHGVSPIATITRMRTERLLRLIGSEPDRNVDTYHDRVRETILRGMPTERRKQLHVRLGEEIERSLTHIEVSQRTTPRVYDLAYHFFEAGDDRAFEYQLQAGEQSLRAYALDDAIKYLQRAEGILPEIGDSATRYRLFSRLGTACGLAQQPQQGLAYWTAALPQATNATERASALEGIGESHHRMGEFATAVSSFNRALRELGRPQPESMTGLLLQTNRLLGYCLVPALIRPFRNEAEREQNDTISRVSHAKAQIYLATGDLVRYTHSATVAAYNGLRSGAPGAMSLGFAKTAFNNAAVSLRFLARLQARRARRLLGQGNDPVIGSNADAMLGCASFCLGDLSDAEQFFQRAITVLDVTGDTWMRIGAHHNLRHVYSSRGHSKDAYRKADLENRIGEAVSDRETICWGQYGMADACARLGRLDEAHDHVQRALAAIDGRRSFLSESIAYNHYAFVLLQSSLYSGAIEAAERARQLMEKRFFYVEYLVHAYPLLIEALLGPNWCETRCDEDTRRARSQLWKTRFFGARFPTIRPHAQRVFGRFLCTRGKRRQAIRCFGRSIASARQIGAEYELARSLLDLAMVDEDRREVSRSEAISILKRLEAVIPYAERRQLGDEPDESCVAPMINPDEALCR